MNLDRLKELAGLEKEEIQIDVPDNASYQAFAKAVAKVLKEGYGKHNYKPFIQALVAELKDESR